MTELEFHSLANEGYNRIPLIAEARADRAQRRELVPAGIRRGRRALRALLVHRPAGPHDLDRAEWQIASHHRWQRHRDGRRRSARVHRAISEALQGRDAPRPAAFLRWP